MSHKCEICLREFKRIYELERHKIRINKCKAKHLDDFIVVNTISSNPPENTIKNYITPPITPILLEHNIDYITSNKCNNCNKQFTRSDNYNRHILYRCKFIDETIKKDDNNVIELLTQLKEQQIKMEEVHKQEILELKNTINELKEQKSSTGLSISNNNNNNTTNSNNTTNNITNNNIKIIAFGFENPAEVLTDKDIQYIIGSHKNSMIQRSIQSTHFNNRLPQFHNVYIP